MIGDGGKTDPFILSKTGFEKGTRTQTKIQLKKIGNLQSVKLITNSKKPYRCRYI